SGSKLLRNRGWSAHSHRATEVHRSRDPRVASNGRESSACRDFHVGIARRVRTAVGGNGRRRAQVGGISQGRLLVDGAWNEIGRKSGKVGIIRIVVINHTLTGASGDGDRVVIESCKIGRNNKNEQEQGQNNRQFSSGRSVTWIPFAEMHVVVSSR